MTPLAVANNDIGPRQLELLAWVRQFVADLPENPDASCHGVCAAVAAARPDDFVHYRGKFDSWDHSWLACRKYPHTILDPYPIACGSGPLLVTTNGMTPWRYLYKGEPVT